MKPNNAILIERRKPKRKSRSRFPVETRPTNDFVEAIKTKTPPEVSLFKTYSVESLKP